MELRVATQKIAKKVLSQHVKIQLQGPAEYQLL